MVEKLLTWCDILADTPVIVPPKKIYTKNSWVHGWAEEEKFIALVKYYNENPDAVGNIALVKYYNENPEKFRGDNPLPNKNIQPPKYDIINEGCELIPWKWYHKILEFLEKWFGNRDNNCEDYIKKNDNK